MNKNLCNSVYLISFKKMQIASNALYSKDERKSPNLIMMGWGPNRIRARRGKGSVAGAFKFIISWCLNSHIPRQAFTHAELTSVKMGTRGNVAVSQG